MIQLDLPIVALLRDIENRHDELSRPVPPGQDQGGQLKARQVDSRYREEELRSADPTVSSRHAGQEPDGARLEGLSRTDAVNANTNNGKRLQRAEPERALAAAHEGEAEPGDLAGQPHHGL